MDTILDFIASLENEEKRIVRSYIYNFVSREDPDNREKLLLDHILNRKKKEISNNSLAMSCGYKSVNENYRKLKSRLFHKVLEALTLDQYLEKDNVLQEVDRHTIRLKKNMLQFRVLYRTGKRGAAVLLHLLDDIISEGKKHEVFDLVSEALYFKRHIMGHRRGSKQDKELIAQSDYYNEAYRKLQRTNDDYLHLVANSEFASELTDQKLSENLDKAISDAEKNFRSTRSVKIGYFLLRLKIADSQYKKDYRTALAQCEELLALLKKDPLVFRKDRMGIVYDYIGKNHIFLGEYSKAYQAEVKAREFYKKGSFNAMISIEQEFRGCFYAKNYAKAGRLLFSLHHHPANEVEFRKDRFTFYQACYHFMQGNHRKALEQLEHTLKLTKDKGRWELSVKVLRAQCFITLGQFDKANDQVEAMRKSIERTSKIKAIPGRDLLIYRVLYHLGRNNFHFSKKDEQLMLLYDQLRAEGTNTWQPFSHELIPFHNWLKQCLAAKRSQMKPLPASTPSKNTLAA